jgi:hypothetical protein
MQIWLPCRMLLVWLALLLLFDFYTSCRSLYIAFLLFINPLSYLLTVVHFFSSYLCVFYLLSFYSDFSILYLNLLSYLFFFLSSLHHLLSYFPFVFMSFHSSCLIYCVWLSWNHPLFSLMVCCMIL